MGLSHLRPFDGFSRRIVTLNSSTGRALRDQDATDGLLNCAHNEFLQCDVVQRGQNLGLVHQVAREVLDSDSSPMRGLSIQRLLDSTARRG